MQSAELTQRINRTLAMIGLDSRDVEVTLVRDVLEPFDATPPELDDDFAALLRQIDERTSLDAREHSKAR